MNEIRTGLGTKFVKEVVENINYEYCNRSKAEAAAKLANDHAINFARYTHNNPCVFNNGLSMEMVLERFNKEYY